jgi:Asp-tRNA(Asn)/Glu-tRNA(Gln) amidotransferase A subunit family amidase
VSSWLAITEIAEKVRSGELKSVDLVKKSLAMIEETKDYNAIISTLEKRALARAEKSTKTQKANWPACRLLLRIIF